MTEYCSNCRFWIAIHSEAGGDCRRHPPRIIETAARADMDESVRCGEAATFDRSVASMASRFPATDGMDWCGEYARASGSGER